VTRIAITGGTGFVGGNVAAELRAAGHDVVALGRRDDILEGLVGCEAVVHCAGINREIGRQTYDVVHIQLTRDVIDAARAAGVRRIVMISFLRARPDCGSGYHESKWAAEELIRGSGLDWTVVKAGVIYGRGDHLLDHLSRSFQTLPLFGLVGLRDRRLAPVAVADVARMLVAAAPGDGRLRNRTVSAVGPDQLTLREVVRRVADVVGKRPLVVPLPVVAQRLVAWIAEWTMVVPLISRAQVRILAEGVVEPLPAAEPLPADLIPQTRFDATAIRTGLPGRARFGRADLRLCSR
jgi:uncharacterized protein YbjT (DUF2867 family)